MPHLLLFVPCRSAIIDRDDNSLTIIKAFYGMNQELGDIPPENVFSPLDWAIAIQWSREDSDSGKTFEQHTKMVDPDGRTSFEHKTHFDMPEMTRTMGVKVNGFPISKEGRHALVLLIREEGQEWQEIATHPMTVSHKWVENNDAIE